MKSLSLSWSDVRYGGLKAVCETVESALAEVGVNFYYLVGAQARDLWYAREHSESRITRDVDFAILVTDAAQYETVKSLLKKSYGFDDSKENAFSMRSPCRLPQKLYDSKVEFHDWFVEYLIHNSALHGRLALAAPAYADLWIRR